MTTYAVHGSEYNVNRFVGFCRRFAGFTATVYNLEGTYYAAGELPLPDGRVIAIAREHRLITTKAEATALKKTWATLLIPSFIYLSATALAKGLSARWRKKTKSPTPLCDFNTFF